MDDAAARRELGSTKAAGPFTARPTIYILILLAAFAGSYLYTIRTNNIFACQASGYTLDKYLIYCEAKNYGDYEHGAFWFNLEPEAEISAAKADVVFLGNSRTQFAFSTAATTHWFSNASATYYLLGFLLWENSIFEGALLHKLTPRAEIYIINIPDFFQPSETPIAKVIMNDPGTRFRYQVKRVLQIVHKTVCMKLTAICGHTLVIYGSRKTGMWDIKEIGKFSGSERPVSYDPQIDKRDIDDGIAIGRKFLSQLHARPECIILTAVPYVGTKLGVADAIAKGLGKQLVVPRDLDGLQTFDGFHLDPPSAERWTTAFYKVAGPQIQKCLQFAHQGG
jgi:hypothetical protein